MKNRRTLAEAKILMERHEMSGLSVQAFCVEELLNPGTFYYWRKRLQMNDNREPSVLVPVCIDKQSHRDSASGSKTIELNYPNGVRLAVPCQSDLNLIRELIMLV